MTRSDSSLHIDYWGASKIPSNIMLRKSQLKLPVESVYPYKDGLLKRRVGKKHKKTLLSAANVENVLIEMMFP
jgi:hypothetical protein